MKAATKKPPTGKGIVEIGVASFGQSCLEDPGATMTVEAAAALSLAWSRVAQAIRAREYGKVTVIDEDGDEILYVGLDYANIRFDMKKGLPLIKRFSAGRISYSDSGFSERDE